MPGNQNAELADTERLSEQAWEYHRERQLRELGVDPEALEGDQDV